MIEIVGSKDIYVFGLIKIFSAFLCENIEFLIFEMSVENHW